MLIDCVRGDDTGSAPRIQRTAVTAAAFATQRLIRLIRQAGANRDTRIHPHANEVKIDYSFTSITHFSRFSE
ncbi:hypothetical protein [Burkholderia ubonensis]|uniref:hypothetical protein n=1 Tax=Burkholderia ubonensis TaxID=101571 RepID=UPI001056C625|nr:hypothetical protein [Burkholderia ubonensis]